MKISKFSILVVLAIVGLVVAVSLNPSVQTSSSTTTTFTTTSIVYTNNFPAGVLSAALDLIVLLVCGSFLISLGLIEFLDYLDRHDQ